ncbi:hypothetical protein MKX01_014391 [Papaver californicum]|nr:hypothetical protein MKX01_014391 [Papaver californicum]
MHAIALWIFLEGMGFPNIVQKLLRTHDMVVNMIMDEAVLCLGWVQSVIPPAPVFNVSDMPLTEELVGGMPINLTLIVFESFSIAFDDIIQEVSGMSFAQLNVHPLMQDQHNTPLMLAGGSASSLPRNLPNYTLLDKEEHLPETKRVIFFTFLHSPQKFGCIWKINNNSMFLVQSRLAFNVLYSLDDPKFIRIIYQ